MGDFKRYKRLGFAEARPVAKGETVDSLLDADVSISQADLNNNSPKEGDMIARNPENHHDKWLIANDYWISNFEQTPMED